MSKYLKFVHEENVYFEMNNNLKIGIIYKLCDLTKMFIPSIYVRSHRIKRKAESLNLGTGQCDGIIIQVLSE